MPKAVARELVIEPSEIQLILDTAKAENYLHYLYIRLICLSGCRKGEFETLRWENIKDNKINFYGKTEKTSITIHKKLQDVLDEIKKQHNNREWVFCNNNGIWIGRRNNNRIWKIFKKYVRKLGLNDKYTLHTIRASMISHQLQRVNAYTVKKLVGHARLSTTEGYDHLGTKDAPEPEWWIEKTENEILLPSGNILVLPESPIINL